MREAWGAHGFYDLQLLAGAFRLDVINSVYYSNGLVFWIEAVDRESARRRQVDGHVIKIV